MNWAILKNNIVINVIVADENFIQANYPNAVAIKGPCGIGWTYDNGIFVNTADRVIEKTDDDSKPILNP